MEPYTELVQRFREFRLLESIGAVVGWDQHTYMPAKGADHRAEQMGYLAKLGHEKLTSPRLGELLGQVTPAGETQAVNVRAPMLLAQVVVPGMIERQSGKIVNVSTVASVVGCEGHAAYSASKGGMNSLTQVMAAEWGPLGIQTNAIAPCIVLTEMGRTAWSDEAKAAPVKARIPVRRFGEPVEIADLVLYLASPASDFVCGQVLLIDGGYSAV